MAFRVGEIRRDTQFDDTLRFFLLVLHSGSQNKKKPVVGCHNRLFRCFEGQLHSSGQMVVKIQTIYFFKEKEFAIGALDNTILAEQTLYSR